MTHVSSFIDPARLEELIANRYIVRVAHPTAPLYLYNYTVKTQYEAMWTPETRICRGLVLDQQGNVAARPLMKFFNVGERPETRLERLAALGAPEVAHKLDGSMCVLYPYAGGQRLATRGSFTSEQAVRATAIWHERYAPALSGPLDPDLTYVFELIGPGNRVVVRYDTENLVLIGLVVTATGRELSYREVRREGCRLGLPHVEEEPHPDGEWAAWQTLLEAQRANFEGFVLFWPAHNLRVKAKLAEYVRLHRLFSGLSEHLLWEHLRDGTDLDTLRAVVPEETLPWLDATVASLSAAYAALDAEVARIVALVRAAGLDPADRADRKAVAELVLREGGEVRPAVFRALDGKEYASLLWKLLEPRNVEPIRALEEA